jgi:hypothetical protein
MKKVNLLSLIVIGFVFTFFSCSKNDGPANDPPACRIVTIIPGSGDSIHIKYNAEGKIASSKQGTTVKNFKYSGNSIIINENIITAGDIIFQSKTFVTVNEHGLATNAKTENNVSGTDWTSLAFEYIGKEVVKQVSTSSGGITSIITMKWTNGNLTSLASGINTATIEYYADKPSRPGDFWHLKQLLEKGYFIIASKNAVKSQLFGGTFANIFYITDNEGKFTSTSLDFGTPPVETYIFEYQCN